MEYVKLGEIADLEMGKTPARNNSRYWNGNNTWVSISDLKEKYIVESKEKITDTAVSDTKIKEVPENTVIMSFKLSIGKKAITTKKLYTNEAIIALNIKDKTKVDVEYLYYALENVDFLRYTDKAAKGKTLNKEKLKKIKIPICSIKKQKEIVENLNIINVVINKQKEQLKNINELYKSLFYEMFGDPIRNEKGWEVKKLKNISYVNDKKKILTPKEKYWLLNLEEIEAGSGRIILKKRIKYEDLPSSISYFDKNWILYSKLRPYLNKVVLSDEEGFCTSELIALRPNLEYLTDVFLWKYLMNNTILEYLKIHVSGAKMPRVVMEDFKNLKVVIPPLELQQKFSERIRDIDKLKFEIEQSLKETENLYNSLMQKFF